MTIAPSGENVPRLVFVSVAKRAPLVTSNTLRSCPFEATNNWVLFGFMVTLWIVWSSEPMPLDHGIVLFTAPDGRSMISMRFPSFSSIRPSEDNATAVVWSKNSNGLKWRGLGFCTGSLFEWAFPTGKLRLQSRFHEDRKSTRLNSSHGYISYAVFCLKKKKTQSCLLIHIPQALHYYVPAC